MNIYKIAGVIFGIAGLVSLFITILLSIDTLKIVNNCEKVEAVVTKYKLVDEIYYPILKIDNLDKIIQLNSGSNEPQYEIGEKLSILYYNEEPEKSLVDDWKEIIFTPGISLFITAGMLLFGIGFSANTFFIELKGKRLVRIGSKIQAKIIELEHHKLIPQDYGKSVPYIIRAEWINPENNVKLKFRSEYLQYKPNINAGDFVDVYINSKNPKDYYMDVKKEWIK